MSSMSSEPRISVIILNRNGLQWLQRCFDSIETQTLFSEIEVLFADNQSSDASDVFAAQWLARLPHGRLVQTGGDTGYCAGNNSGAAVATGKYLFFLNNDAWLEPDCLEKLWDEVEAAGADAASPLVLNYDDDTLQSIGGSGLDLFGLMSPIEPPARTVEIFAACGAAYFIRRAMFERVGGFDAALFMYGDETDLSCRVQIAGGRIVAVPAARVHPRGAGEENPDRHAKPAQLRTSETKRYLANRNGLLFLLKNAEHALLLLLVPHLLLLMAEAVASLVLVRRWGYVRKAYLKAVTDCWRMRGHVAGWRDEIAGFRRRGDLEMLRFLRLRPNRWEEVRRVFQRGVPVIKQR